MESLNPLSVDFSDHGVTPVIGRPKPLPPEINKAIREQKRKVKLTDFSRDADQILNKIDGSLTDDSEELVELHKLMARISGSDLTVRNEMASMLNSKLKKRGHRLRVCKVEIQTKTINPTSFKAYRKANNILSAIRDHTTEFLKQHKHSKSTISIDNSNHHISLKTIVSLVSHCLEAQIMAGVISGELALKFAGKTITSESRIRNSNFVELFLDPDANTSLERPTYKIVVPRLLGAVTDKVKDQLEKDLSQSNSRKPSEERLTLDGYIEKAYVLPEFLDILSSIVRAAGMEKPRSVSSALQSVGKELRSIASLYLPHYLVDTYSGKYLYTPLRQSDEKAFITHMRIVRNEMRTLGNLVNLGLKSEHKFSDEGLPVVEFKSLCIEFLQVAYRKNSRGGTSSFQSLLESEIDRFLKHNAEVKKLSSIQWALVRFLLFMAKNGTPKSTRNKRKGGYTTLSRYLEEICIPLQVVFAEEDFFELSAAEIMEGIDEILLAKSKRQWAAQRFAYFFYSLEVEKLIDPISEEIAYSYGSNHIFPARSQVISKQHFAMAIAATNQIQSLGERTICQLALSLGYRAGLRWGEVCNLQLEDIQISNRGIVVTVKRKGRWRPKSRFGNRWVICIGNPTFTELKAFIWLKKNIQGKHDRKTRVMDFLLGSTSLVQRNALHRLINDLLKEATGNEGARFHDLRHTWVNTIILNYHSTYSSSSYFKNLVGNAVDSISIPTTLLKDGHRAPFAGKALKENAGHRRFNPTTIAGYYHYLAEDYAEAWSETLIAQPTLSQYQALTDSSVNDEKEMSKVASAKIDTRADQKKFSQKYSAVHIHRNSSGDFLEPSVSNIGRVLLGAYPDGVSAVDLTSRKGRQWLDTVVDTFKSLVRELEISRINTAQIKFQRIEQGHSLLDLRFKKRLLEMLKNSAFFEIDTTKLDFPKSYRGHGAKDYLVFDRPDSLGHFIDTMKKLNLQFENARFFLKQGECFLPVLQELEQPSAELPRKLAKKLLYRDESSVCVFRLEGKAEEGPHGMQDMVNFLLFLETSDRLKTKSAS